MYSQQRYAISHTKMYPQQLVETRYNTTPKCGDESPTCLSGMAGGISLPSRTEGERFFLGGRGTSRVFPAGSGVRPLLLARSPLASRFLLKNLKETKTLEPLVHETSQPLLPGGVDVMAHDQLRQSGTATWIMRGNLHTTYF